MKMEKKKKKKKKKNKKNKKIKKMKKKMVMEEKKTMEGWRRRRMGNKQGQV